MKLSSDLLESPIRFEEDCVQVLILEHPFMMRKFVSELCAALGGEENGCQLYWDLEPVLLSKYLEVVFNPIQVEINNRKVLSALYQQLKEQAYDETMYVKTQAFLGQFETYISALTSASEEALTFTPEFDWSALFKLVNVKVEEDADSMLERIQGYISWTSRVLGKTVFAFINLKSFLTDEELKMLYTFCLYEKVYLFLIESADVRKRLVGERTRVVDCDFCEI